MDERPVQDFYPQKWSHCYGCGRLNEHGLHVQTSWLDDQAGTSRSRFTPEAYHVSLPGFVYGGLLASLIDCHGTGTATLAAYRAEQRPLGSLPQPRFVTGSLHVDYLRPTPLTTLTLIGRINDDVQQGRARLQGRGRCRVARRRTRVRPRARRGHPGAGGLRRAMTPASDDARRTSPS